MAEGTYIKDLKEIDDASDSCDLIIEDETPTTMRIKLGDLKTYITQEVNTQVTNALSRISTNESAITTINNNITSINNDLSDLMDVKSYTLSNSYFADLKAYKWGRFGIITNNETYTLGEFPSDWFDVTTLPDELRPTHQTYAYSISQSLAVYEILVEPNSCVLRMIIRDGSLGTSSRVPFIFCYLTAS